MSKKGDAYTIHINSKKLARLLLARIVSINKDNQRKYGKRLPVLDKKKYQHIIEEYFKLCFEQAIETGKAISFPFIGNIQVIKKISAKGYAWDKKYNGKDYELVINTSRDMIITVDEKYYPQVISKVDSGMEYEYEPVNIEERVEEILSLINGKRGIKQRRNKIVA